MIVISEITEKDLHFVRNEIIRMWGADSIVTRGRIWLLNDLPGFVARIKGQPAGIILYNILADDCEILSLHSIIERKGVARSLIDKVKKLATERKCRRIWLITTNDNVQAIRYYLKYGFQLKQVYRNAIEKSRKLKPEIPLLGLNDIPILHELEFELLL
ncbi:MAG: GNAT family N-acetyltransferase [Candidatus Cloacimonetes bacterium]|nr:GNAT family N-acetyltransferase [Candidatus Cloacimonadota bacterium]